MKLYTSVPKECAHFALVLDDLMGIKIFPESIISDYNIINSESNYSLVQFDDLISIKLSELPFELPDFLVAAALLKRNSPNYCLTINPDKIEMGKDFMLLNQARILCEDTFSSLQLKWLRPDFQITLLENISPISEYDATFMQSEVDFNHIDSWLKYDIQISEIIPKPGEGVVVILCHKENINLRKILKEIHCDKTASSTNIERTVLNSFIPPHRQFIGVHCEQDTQSNFQVNAISLLPEKPVKKIHYSTVTSFELDKIVIDKLKE